MQSILFRYSYHINYAANIRIYESPFHFLAKMSVFAMAHNLTNRPSTEKDYIQPFTIMAEEHPPSPICEDEPLARGRLRVKPAMTV
jgi:hypothetical protein